MSITDPSADPVQPDAGQGGEGAGNPAYAEYLDRIPDDARGVAEEAFKAWDANYTRHQQEASEYRKGWEPYEQAGVNQFSPQDIQEAFRLLNDPQALRTWADQQYGPPSAPESPQPGADDPYGLADPTQQLEQLLKAQLAPFEKRFEQYDQRWQAQEQQEITRRGEQIVESQFAELKSKHPDAFSDDGPHGARKIVEALALNYVDSDPDHAIPRAFADYQALRGSFEKSLLEGKKDAPLAAESGGVPDVSVAPPKTLADAEAALVAQLRHSNAG